MPVSGEISLYFHIPFCSRKCPYCHFYVLPDQDRLKKQLEEALKLEWQKIAPFLKDKKLVSIYFGGGTPTLMGSAAISRILSWIDLPSEDIEITLEANPENVSLQLMQEMREAGINRVSIGVQSLDDNLLAFLGRTHNAKKAIEAVEITHQAGIVNVSIDLMYDLPHQSLESWKKTLSFLPSLPITHLSLYNLTFEAPTAFFKKERLLRPHLPTPEVSLTMLEEAVFACEGIGLQRYEISAFAKPSFTSRHNTGYWLARPFLGLGPSAFSHYEGRRFRNKANLSFYHKALLKSLSPIDFEEKLPYPDNLHELLAVQLRMLEGVNLTTFQQRHGDLPSTTYELFLELQSKGWLARQGDHIKLTPQGLLFYDSLASEII